MHITFLKLLGFFVLTLVVNVQLYAQDLHTQAVFQTQDLRGNLVTCGTSANGWVPGQLDRKQIFSSLKAALAKYRRSLKKVRSSKSKLALQAKIKRLRSKIKLHNYICSQGPHPTPTPTANFTDTTATPQATPLPGQTPLPMATPSGPFDQNGNTNGFGIPAGYNGNISVGAISWVENCKACHTIERRNRSYQQLLNAVYDVPQMRGFQYILSVQDLADLTAYLNRID